MFQLRAVHPADQADVGSDVGFSTSRLSGRLRTFRSDDGVGSSPWRAGRLITAWSRPSTLSGRAFSGVCWVRIYQGIPTCWLSSASTRAARKAPVESGPAS